MTVTSYKSPGTTSSESRSGSGDDTFWINPDNVKVSDDSIASSNQLGKNEYGDWLRITNFGFSIPDGATINGIEIQREGRSEVIETLKDSAIYLRKTSGQVGSNFSLATFWPNSEATVTYGDSSDLFGTTWTYTEINSSNFGLDFSVFNDEELGGAFGFIDHIQIRVHYTAPAGGASQGMISITGVQSITI